MKEYLKIFLLPLLFLFSQFLFLFIAGVIYSFFDDLSKFSSFINNNSYIIMILNLIIFLPIFKQKYKEYQDEYNENSKNLFKIYIIGLILSLSLNFIIYYIKLKMNVEMSQSFSLWNLINTIIVGPILEEYLFRGIIYNKIKDISNSKKALIITSMIFAIIHVNLLNIIYGLIMGLVLNIIYIKGKNLKYSIYFHIIINFIGSLIFPILVTL